MHNEPFVREEGGVLKINEFEKHYIIQSLQDEIAQLELLIDRSGDKDNKVTNAFLRDLKTVLERVETMPSTRW